MKKILVTVFCAFLLFAVLTGCAGSGGQSDVPDTGVEINVYNWGEYMDTDLLDRFYEDTGIKVNYSTFNTNEDMYAKIKSGGVSYDVIVPSDYMLSRMISEGMLEKLDFNNIPNFSLIRDDLKKPEYDQDGEYSVPYAWGIVGIIYDKTQVTDPVDSWDILWDEKYKGQILMFDNSRDALGIALKRRGYSFNTTDETQLRAAADDLTEQKNAVQAYVMDQIFDKMENGDALIAPYYAGDYITMSESNENLAFAIPKEGTNRFVDAMCIPKGSEHKKEAEEFINFMTRTDVAKQNIEYIGYSTPSKAVYDELSDDVKNSVSYPSDDVLKNSETYTNLPQDTLELYDRLWIEIFK